ncbi:MAG: Hint domain-containing protein [Jhaorihella sp.]
MFGWMRDESDAVPGTDDQGVALSDILITGHAGLLSGMDVATDRGWRKVDMLRVGDKVLTFDRGPQPLVDIQRESVHPGGRAAGDAICPIRVPKGALNNDTDIWLMPDQGLLVESETVRDVLDDPFGVCSC